MKAKANILLYFYKSYFAVAFIVSAVCAYLFYHYGVEAIGALFWLKIMADMAIMFFINKYKNKEFYYYYNLGLSRTMLWAISLTADFILFSILILLSSLVKTCIH
jgi:hypothetical protein